MSLFYFVAISQCVENINSVSSKFVQYTHQDQQLQFGSFKMSHGTLSKWKIVYKRQICFLEVCLQKSCLQKNTLSSSMLEVVWGLNITWKSGAIWKSAPIQNILRKYPFKHLQKLNGNVGIVTITLQKKEQLLQAL